MAFIEYELSGLVHVERVDVVEGMHRFLHFFHTFQGILEIILAHHCLNLLDNHLLSNSFPSVLLVSPHILDVLLIYNQRSRKTLLDYRGLLLAFNFLV